MTAESPKGRRHRVSSVFKIRIECVVYHDHPDPEVVCQPGHDLALDKIDRWMYETATAKDKDPACYVDNLSFVEVDCYPAISEKEEEEDNHD